MRYYCMKYSRWMTRHEIEVTHKNRCFGVKRGHRRGRLCRMLVRV